MLCYLCYKRCNISYVKDYRVDLIKQTASRQQTGQTISTARSIQTNRTNRSAAHVHGTRAPIVEMRALTKRYEEGNETRSVIQNAESEIYRGEFVALAGPSGSGKTTLLNLVSGIDTPTSGDVLINSVSITNLTEKERTLFRRKNIGFVFQFFNLIPTLSVRENLLLPLQLNNFSNVKSERRISELLERVGMRDRLDSYPDRLSGGEQQRVAIARALAHDPLLVLADEPTGNLDSETGMSILLLLKSMVEDSGKTMIIVSHSDVVVRMANRVLTMEDGRLVERTPGDTRITLPYRRQSEQA